MLLRKSFKESIAIFAIVSITKNETNFIIALKLTFIAIVIQKQKAITIATLNKKISNIKT